VRCRFTGPTSLLPPSRLTHNRARPRWLHLVFPVINEAHECAAKSLEAHKSEGAGLPSEQHSDESDGSEEDEAPTVQPMHAHSIKASDTWPPLCLKLFCLLLL
jgi:hypothetical protein